jgi:cytochrome c
MSSWDSLRLKGLAAAFLACAAGMALAQGKTYPGIGRAATTQEVAAWDIDVRPDFKGLPAGSGTVAGATRPGSLRSLPRGSGSDRGSAP